LIKKRWGLGIFNLVLVFGCGRATVFTFAFLVSSMLGPSEDRFADNLTIPEDIEVADPEEDATDPWGRSTPKGSDSLQGKIRMALAVSGTNKSEVTPSIPSLRKASTDHFKLLCQYLEASPDWYVFVEHGNRFAVRRWSYGGVPRDTLNGYISEFSGVPRFQTRCLLCLDGKRWGRYLVQRVQEGVQPVNPKISRGNELYESRMMIECGGVWVEIFEQADSPERRVTKATVNHLEEEFADFLNMPEDTVYAARTQSGELAKQLADGSGHPFRLLTGMQPGIYDVVYLLNPGEPGSVYLKAFEVTKGIPLSAIALEAKSRSRMTWSADPSERFFARAGFMIYEGDWGKPYAARFEVWFTPDAGKGDQKLSERVFRIEGWQR
jgi:hypothetical protein